MFQEKYELTRRIESLRAELANVIDMRALVPRVLAALEDSRRITHASIYLVDPDGSGYELAGHVGPRPEGRFDAIAHRAFFERLRRAGVISLEGLERELAARRPVSTEEQREPAADAAHARADERLGRAGLLRRGPAAGRAGASATSACARPTPPTRSSCSAAWPPRIGITLQNSQVYERMKERDRLAALGEMAAGLAHEIRNPLGAIKGAAQLPAADGHDGAATRDRDTREFLDIIVEEANRLNNIVSQFLDYARAATAASSADSSTSTRSCARRCAAARSKEAEDHGKVEIVTDFAEQLPPVARDAEQLLQVFLNLGAERAAGDAQRRHARISTSAAALARRGLRPVLRGPLPRHRRRHPARAT